MLSTLKRQLFQVLAFPTSSSKIILTKEDAVVDINIGEDDEDVLNEASICYNYTRYHNEFKRVRIVSSASAIMENISRSAPTLAQLESWILA